jgi:YggT family protein
MGLVVWIMDTAITLYSFILVARAFLPLMGVEPYHPVLRLLYDLTEPVLAPLRRWTIRDQYDFSPVVVVLGLMLLRQVLISLLYWLV